MSVPNSSMRSTTAGAIFISSCSSKRPSVPNLALNAMSTKCRNLVKIPVRYAACAARLFLSGLNAFNLLSALSRFFSTSSRTKFLLFRVLIRQVTRCCRDRGQMVAGWVAEHQSIHAETGCWKSNVS
ncbi:unnamed protein product [Cercospora beticola]|nr:unnamed protein product [Cercospora beticola]